jgi:hypothetical protein
MRKTRGKPENSQQRKVVEEASLTIRVLSKIA